MEHIVAAWDMVGHAIDQVVEFAIVLVAAGALVGRKVEICP